MMDDVPLPEPTATPRINDDKENEAAVKKKKSLQQKMSSKLRKSMDKFKRSSFSSNSFTETIRRSFSMTRSSSSKSSPNGKPPLAVSQPKAKSPPKPSVEQPSFADTPTSPVASSPEKAVESPVASEQVEVTAQTGSPAKSAVSAAAEAASPSPAKSSTPEPTQVAISSPAKSDESTLAEAEEVASPAAKAMADAMDAADDVVICDDIEETMGEPKQGPARRMVRAVTVTALIGASVAAGLVVNGRKKKSV